MVIYFSTVQVFLVLSLFYIYIQELEAERQKAEGELKIAQQNIKILQNEARRLTRKQRTHRLCNHGGLLECFLPPDQFSDEQMEAILKEIFRKPETRELLERIKTEAVQP